MDIDTDIVLLSTTALCGAYYYLKRKRLLLEKFNDRKRRRERRLSKSVPLPSIPKSLCQNSSGSSPIKSTNLLKARLTSKANPLHLGTSETGSDLDTDIIPVEVVSSEPTKNVAYYNKRRKQKARIPRSRNESDNILDDLRNGNPDVFLARMRMNVEQFESLLQIVGARLTKVSQRDPLSPDVRLALTLRYLASGESMKVIAKTFKVGASTMCNIVRETCSILYDEMAPLVIGPPSTDAWLEIANGFEEKWNVPHCIGALDAKHIALKVPGSKNNPHKNPRMILVATCDHNYCFTTVDISPVEDVYEGGILTLTDFHRHMESNTMGIPEDEPIYGSSELANVDIPYFFVADNTFPLKKQIMRPYGNRNISTQREVFNNRIARAKQCIDNAFGVLLSRWKILDRAIISQPNTVEGIIKSSMCLHNFLMKSEQYQGKEVYCPPLFLDQPIADSGGFTKGLWRDSVFLTKAALRASIYTGRMGAWNSRVDYQSIRDKLALYMNCEECWVPWQLLLNPATSENTDAAASENINNDHNV